MRNALRVSDVYDFKELSRKRNSIHAESFLAASGTTGSVRVNYSAAPNYDVVLTEPAPVDIYHEVLARIFARSSRLDDRPVPKGVEITFPIVAATPDVDIDVDIVLVLSDEEIAWNSYLRKLGELGSPHVPSVVVEGITKVREQLHNYFGMNLLPPQAAPGEDGGIQLAWDENEHHLSVDVLPDNTLQWFYRNRNTGLYDGDEGLSTDRFPPAALQALLAEWRLKKSGR